MLPAACIDAARQLIEIAAERQAKIATVESCTGGLIAGCLTEIAGASKVFEYGFVTYANHAKSSMIGVLPQTLAAYGAVSRTTVLQMAAGGLLRARASLAVAVTGIAGPAGGDTHKPTGLVHIAVCRNDGLSAHLCRIFGGDRQEVRRQSVIESLKLATTVLTA